jgi:hypothetical protein
MDSIKRFYLSIAAGLAHLTGNKTLSEKMNSENVVSRVSREVNYYRTHFFNL